MFNKTVFYSLSSLWGNILKEEKTRGKKWGDLLRLPCRGTKTQKKLKLNCNKWNKGSVSQSTALPLSRTYRGYKNKFFNDKNFTVSSSKDREREARPPEESTGGS